MLACVTSLHNGSFTDFTSVNISRGNVGFVCYPVIVKAVTEELQIQCLFAQPCGAASCERPALKLPPNDIKLRIEADEYTIFNQYHEKNQYPKAK